MFKPAMITDLHLGPDRNSRLGSNAKSILESFISYVNDPANGIDCAIALGDMYTASDKDDALKKLKEVLELFRQCRVPFHIVPGNHCVNHLGMERVCEELEIPAHPYVIRKYGFDLLMGIFNVSPERQKDGTRRFRMLPEHQVRLKELLTLSKKADVPVIGFSHVPQDNSPENDRFAFAQDKGLPGISYYPQGYENQRVMKETGNVILWFAGHKHCNKITNIEGAWHVTLQSAIEKNIAGSPSEPGRPAAHWRTFLVAEIDRTLIRLAYQGMDDPCLPAHPGQPDSLYREFSRVLDPVISDYSGRCIELVPKTALLPVPDKYLAKGPV